MVRPSEETSVSEGAAEFATVFGVGARRLPLLQGGQTELEKSKMGGFAGEGKCELVIVCWREKLYRGEIVDDPIGACGRQQ